MNLTNEQLEIAKKKMMKLEKKFISLSQDPSYDLHEKVKLAYEIKEYTKLISLATILEFNNSENIGLGSRFSATIFSNNEIHSGYYLLSDVAIDVDNYKAISVKTPFAQAVINKKANESFTYNVSGNEIKGIINEIIMEKDIDSSKLR